MGKETVSKKNSVKRRLLICPGLLRLARVDEDSPDLNNLFWSPDRIIYFNMFVSAIKIKRYTPIYYMKIDII